MGQLIQTFDWSQTPLGPIESWPQSLKSAVSILLPSRAQIALFWGHELTTIYNDAYSQILVEKHPGVLGTPAWVCWSDIWEGRLDGLFQRVLDTGEAFWGDDYLFWMQRRGFREETYFNISYDPVRDESGGVGGIFAIVSETTQRVLGERRLKTLRDLSEQTAPAKNAVDACQIAVEVLGENLSDIPFSLLCLFDNDPVSSVKIDRLKQPWPVPEAGQPIFIDNLADYLPSPPSERAEVLPVMVSNQQVVGFLVVGISPHLVFDTEYRGFFDLVAGHISTAITNARAYEEERKRAEILAELDRAKTEFFSNVSHEFRTPLTLILNPLQQMLENDLLPKHRENLSVAYRNALRLLKLVNTLLDFSRIQSSRIHAVLEPTDLAAFTADLASSFRSAVENAGMSLVIDCPPLPQTVYIDRDMWEKIILNLLSNAFKFTFEGQITVSLFPDGDNVCLTVRDTGIGIELHELPLIFDRFHRVQGARSRSFEGSGIGLSLVQELVRFLGGEIEVTSTPGVGSAFKVTIPYGEPSSSQKVHHTSSIGAQPYVEEALRWLPDTKVQQDGASGGQRVLVVDDNADMRDYLRHLLEARYVVLTAANGEAALELIERERPDLVLADIMMPGMSGVDLLRALRADPDTQTLPVILLSARAGEEARVEGLEQGADDYLVKPFAARELLARVESLLQTARVRDARHESEQRMRIVLENMPMMLFATDEAGHVLMWNHECERVTGYTAEEVLNHPDTPALFYPDPEYREKLAAFHAGNKGDYRNWQVTFTCKDGSTREIIWSNVSARFPVPGWKSWLVGVDVTGLHQAQMRMQSLQDITAALAEALTPSQVAGVIFDRALPVLDGHHGSLGIIHGNQLELLRSSGVSQDVFEQYRFTPLSVSGPMTDAVRTGHPVWIQTQEEYIRRYPHFAGVVQNVTHTHSTAALPLIVNGQTIGALLISFSKPYQIGAESRTFLTTLAGHCAQSLERARLYESERIARAGAEQMVDRLDRLQQVTAALLQATTPDEVIRVVVEQGISAIGGSAGSVVAFKDGQLQVIGSNGYSAEMLRSWNIIPDDTPLALCIREKTPIWIESRDTLDSIFPTNQRVRHRQNGSWAAIPLIAENHAIGAIGLTFPEPRLFSENDRVFILTLAQQAAQALEKSRAYEAEKSARAAAEQTAERLGRLQQITSALSEALTPPEVATIIVNQGFPMLGAHKGGVFVLSEDRQMFKMINEKGFWAELNEQFRHVPVTAATPMGEMLRAGVPVWISTLDEYQAKFPHLVEQIQSKTQTQAVACVPMIVNGRLIGGVGLSFSQPQAFTEVDRLFIISIAQQCAQALERARLFEAETTARKEAQEANSLKLKFLGMISHELRTPLTSIKGFATTLLADDVKFDETSQHYFLDIIDKEADKLTMLVDQLLDLARLQAGTLAIFPEIHPLHKIIEVASAQITMLTIDHFLDVSLPESMPIVYADSQRIAQVLVNLIGNAAKFSPVGSIIALTAELDGDFVRVDVTDQGPGIPLEQRNVIFEAFRQVDSLSQRQNKGAGLGLAICKGIIDSHGGRLWIQESTDSGTTFSFTLPTSIKSP